MSLLWAEARRGGKGQATSTKEKIYDEIRSKIVRCSRCPLHLGRKNAVPGEGNLEAEVMFVGEAPGATEDEQGRPFVGAAGQLLTEAIEAAGLRRDDAYITNVVKCRPPNNRTPTDDEVSACVAYLIEELKLVRPKVIVALGNTAGSTLFKLAGRQWRGITASRGKAIRLNIGGHEALVYPTYHPAAALYKPDLRNVLFSDIKEAVGLTRTSKRRTLMDFMNSRNEEAKDQS